MLDSLVELARQAITSPWIYLAVFAFAAVDAFLPLLPSESLVIAAGVFAASGRPNLVLLLLAAAAGAFAGDHVSYCIGRLGRRPVNRVKPGTRRHHLTRWIRRTLERRGGLIIIVARYIPGGRTVTTVTAGALGYPLRRFSLFDALAGLSWGAYCSLLGYLGGKTFEKNPLLAALFGFGVALLITLAAELVRHLRSRPRTPA
ncbi:DedA family protein [Bailinhaonella thermotolerans]|uniref:DedA family protein n=1 Tax=Bailinhaonella thermotolerans TaxID=1070861 RepID=A0A3A4A850_9ACTN|nr:DedA family protein [Bailinhaonella thermotolerans]RJL22073.1 DedA family protein [Bailinhaonella thermotolerans]